MSRALRSLVVAAVGWGASDEIVASASYKPDLRRSPNFLSMFAIAFSIILITTGIFRIAPRAVLLGAGVDLDSSTEDRRPSATHAGADLPLA
jgi:hypothetical protein